jgi:ABC-type antimicrobial peptide transport system permease subunit
VRVAAGIAVGVGLGLAVSRMASGMLVGVAAWDPLVYLLVVLILSVAAAGAVVFPARRAARCDPATLLREG